MSRGAARRPLTLALVRCGAVAGLPTLLAAAAALLLATCWPAAVEPGAAAAAQSSWLLLPLLTAAGCCALAAVRLWPLFALERPGAAWLWRWQCGPLRGLGAAVSGALLAQFVLTLPLCTVFAQWLGAPAAVHAVLRPELPPLPILQAPGQHFVASLAAPTALKELSLRPRAGLPGAPFVASVLEVRLDGEPQPVLAHSFEQDGLLHVHTLHERRVQHFELRLREGSVPLWFDGLAIECVAAAEHSWLVNGALAALLALLPTLLALAMAMLAGAGAALPTVTLVAVATLFVTTVGAIGPLDATVDAVFRGRWLAGDGAFPQAIPFLAAACLAMIGRMLLLRRPRR